MHLNVADGGPDEGNVGGGSVGDRDPDVGPGGAAVGHRHLHAVRGQTRGPGSGPPGGVGRWVDRRLADTLPGGVNHEDLVADKQAELHESQQEEGNKGQGEGQLDGGLALAA